MNNDEKKARSRRKTQTQTFLLFAALPSLLPTPSPSPLLFLLILSTSELISPPPPPRAAFEEDLRVDVDWVGMEDALLDFCFSFCRRERSLMNAFIAFVDLNLFEGKNEYVGD